MKLSKVKGLLIDVDGTLLRSKAALPGVDLFFPFLRGKGVKFCIATNNSVVSAEQYQRFFEQLGAPVSQAEILTSSAATQYYLERHFPRGGKAYVIGREGLRQSVRQAGFDVLEGMEAAADVAVVGGDPHFTYDHLKYACLHIQNGAAFLGTNPDVLYPSDEGLLPEVGTTLAALKAATGVEARVIGKPEKHLFEAALQRLELEACDVAMLGDRLDTDIVGAKRVGMASILVETGVDNRDSAQQRDINPDMIVRDLPDLMARWEDQ